MENNMLFKRDIHVINGFNGDILGYDVSSMLTISLNQIAAKILSFPMPISLEKVIELLELNGFTRNDILANLEAMKKFKILSEKPLPKDTKSCGEGCSHDKTKVGGLTMNICHSCNMRCDYCFASGGNYKMKEEFMGEKTIKNSIDYLFDNISSSDIIMVSFFGGEPFMNWDGIKTGINHCNERNKAVNKKMIFYITTNGTLVTREHLEFLAQFDVRITVSLDGDRDVNDKHRFFIDGSSAFDKTVKAIELIVSYPQITLQVRPTVDEYGSTKIIETANFLESLGVTRIHFRPMSSLDGTKLVLTKNGYKSMAEGFECLAKKMIDQAQKGKELIDYVNILKFLFLLFFRLRRQFYCGAGSTVISVDPSGNISPCPRFTGMGEFQIGDIHCGGVVEKKQSEFQAFSIKTRPDCNNCWVKNICAGGCLYMHEIDEHGNDDFSVWCELMKSNVESALKTFVFLQKLSPAILPSLIREYPPLLSKTEEALLQYEKHLK